MEAVPRQEPDHGSPSAVERAVGATIAHSEKWGSVWFGLVFFGSVLAAAGRRILPDANSLVITIIALAIGLTAGIVAHVRGAWL